MFCTKLLLSQEIPNDFFEYKKRKLLSDLGRNWSKNTLFGPIRYSQNFEANDSLSTRSRFGTYLSKGKKMLYAYGHFSFKKYFHGYLHPRIVNDPEGFKGYSGIPRDISRGGFTSGETDISGISFENEWMVIQLGRGRQSWGAGNNIQLPLSEESNSYDYGMLDLDFDNLKVRYFHGFLESDSNSVNRYITGRGIEWNNNKNLLLGLSEIVIYSGKDRPIDFSYFNPISTHLEIELNDRQNRSGIDEGNGVWQLSLDYLIMDNLRLSLIIYLMNLFWMKHRRMRVKALVELIHLRLHILLEEENSSILCHLSIISVGTNTFRHGKGSNNFVQRGSPLGWTVGSDSREMNIGFDWLYQKELFLISILVSGILVKNFINKLYDPYTDYLDEPFPSGDVENIKYVSSKVQWWWKPNIAFFSDIEYTSSNKSGSKFKSNFGIDIFYGINKNL